jgi:hypothetical protein
MLASGFAKQLYQYQIAGLGVLLPHTVGHIGIHKSRDDLAVLSFHDHRFL